MQAIPRGIVRSLYRDEEAVEESSGRYSAVARLRGKDRSPS